MVNGLVLLPIMLASTCGFQVSRITSLTSTTPGAGMDKPSSFFSLFSSTGGEFSVRLCSEGSCCQTGALNTEDDNWELGQVDQFIGQKQIEGCYGFHVGEELSLTLKHSGSNAGELSWVRVAPWHLGLYWHCQVGVNLDYTSSHTTQCRKVGEPRPGGWCNGAPEFCSLSVDEFLWAGTHNSGTGQAQGSASCAFKNQDLDIPGQLELGVRLLDIDTIYSTGLPGCDGLMTGHGSNPELGIYQCFGRLDSLLAQIRDWLDLHSTELLVLNFGNIEYPGDTVPKLLEALRAAFPQQGEGVRMNRSFKENGSWPLLGEAVERNERIFVFIRDTVGVVGDDDLEFVREIKVKPGKEFPGNKTETEVYITTSYKAKDIGQDCSYVLDTSRLACQSEQLEETDFLKLSLFSKFGKGGLVGLQCLHKMAKLCNRWVEASLAQCGYRQFRPSMVLLDYPNYQGQSERGLIEVVEQENYNRAASLVGQE